MIHNPELKKHFQQYSRLELIYKRYHQALTEQQDMRSVVEQMKQEYKNTDINWNYFWFPEINPYQQAIRTQELKYPFREDIVIARHMRYHPYFTHTHQFYEMIYVLSGTCTNLVQERPLVMQENSLCIIPPHVNHAIGIFDDSLIVNILIKEKVFENEFSRVLSGKAALVRFFQSTLQHNPGYSCLYYPDISSWGISSILENLILEENSLDDLRYSLKKALLLAVFCYLRRIPDRETQLVANSEQCSDLVYDIKQYLEEHYTTATLANTAEHFNYSAPYLSKMIHKNMGVPFSALLREVKITKACELLSHSKIKISDISNQLGYDTPVYFTRVFKKHTGITPLHYRQKVYSPLKEI